jgi:hypothetical protein
MERLDVILGSFPENNLFALDWKLNCSFGLVELDRAIFSLAKMWINIWNWPTVVLCSSPLYYFQHIVFLVATLVIISSKRFRIWGLLINFIPFVDALFGLYLETMSVGSYLNSNQIILLRFSLFAVVFAYFAALFLPYLSLEKKYDKTVQMLLFGILAFGHFIAAFIECSQSMYMQG